MPIVRRGEIPYPVQGTGPYTDEIYTIRGFFGDWVHLFRKGNLGLPTSWSHDDLIYSGIDTAKAGSIALLTGDGIRVALERPTGGVTQRNLDFHEIRFYHRGTGALETELGDIAVAAGDFVVVGKGLVHRDRPDGDDMTVVTFGSAEPIALAEQIWDAAGFASMHVDYGGMTLPEPGATGGEPTEVRTLYNGEHHTVGYDFDPCRDVVGWTGDPVIYKLDCFSVPGIGTSLGFLPPPAHAVLMAADKSWFFNILRPGPIPSDPRGTMGAPAHLNDYDEVWFNHASELSPHSLGHMWLFPRTIPHPGGKRPTRYPSNPPQALDEIKVNFDTKAQLHWTDEAKAALLEGDVRRNVFVSLYGVPEEMLPPQR